MSSSNFSLEQGIQLSDDTINMSYLYGISDFFAVMFEDTAIVNTLLQASTHQAAGIYSRFLQLTSGLSLEGLQDTIKSDIKLVQIKSSDLISGTKYRLTTPIKSAGFICSRPILPTVTLDNNVDYNLFEETDGTYTITFAKELASYGFPNHTNVDGSISYALWFTDVEVDEKLVLATYGAIFKMNPLTEMDTFKMYLKGLYFIYSQGPTLDILRKGINLALGVPLSRGVEKVLDIRQNAETSQLTVITNANQYTLPAGLLPIVSIGDTLTKYQELSRYIDVTDYLDTPRWWVGKYIPRALIPTLPASKQNVRLVKSGDSLDYIFDNFLKYNTLYVDIVAIDATKANYFSEIIKTLAEIRPSYVYSLSTYAVPLSQEKIAIDDNAFSIRTMDVLTGVTINSMTVNSFDVNSNDAPPGFVVSRDISDEGMEISETLVISLRNVIPNSGINGEGSIINQVII